ncbi:GD13678 [Drosophila simulans]|uniref:GD13678 n=1 Tax=Drosophila simulans TaxID=7240 RepID=B4QNH0_DROSI|nr:GD13678 [Drosophila simulans]
MASWRVDYAHSQSGADHAAAHGAPINVPLPPSCAPKIPNGIKVTGISSNRWEWEQLPPKRP